MIRSARPGSWQSHLEKHPLHTFPQRIRVIKRNQSGAVHHADHIAKLSFIHVMSGGKDTDTLPSHLIDHFPKLAA